MLKYQKIAYEIISFNILILSNMDNIMIPLESSSDAIDLSQNIMQAEDMTIDFGGIRSDRRGPLSLQGQMSEGSPSINKIRKSRRDDKIPFSLEVNIQYFLLLEIIIYKIFNFCYRKINICYNLCSSMVTRNGA